MFGSHGVMNPPNRPQRLTDEALLIAERSSYVLQGADARLELAKLALARGFNDCPPQRTRRRTEDGQEIRCFQ